MARRPHKKKKKKKATGCVRDTNMWHTLRGGHRKQSKMGKYRQKKSASPESERHVQVMSNCVYSCLSLISILRGNLLGFAGLNRCISLGEKSFVFMFCLKVGRFWYLSVALLDFRASSEDLNIIQANWLAKRLAHAFCMLSVYLFVSNLDHWL